MKPPFRNPCPLFVFSYFTSTGIMPTTIVCPHRFWSLRVTYVLDYSPCSIPSLWWPSVAPIHSLNKHLPNTFCHSGSELSLRNTEINNIYSTFSWRTHSESRLTCLTSRSSMHADWETIPITRFVLVLVIPDSTNSTFGKLPLFPKPQFLHL
jgi:hypothetical protein